MKGNINAMAVKFMHSKATSNTEALLLPPPSDNCAQNYAEDLFLY
jgi:hypothetical protein